MASYLIDDLDYALAEDGEDVVLRRPIGEGPSQQFVSVTVRAKLIPVTGRLGVDDSAPGAPQNYYEFVMSPTQIGKAQWPGGALPPTGLGRGALRIPKERVDQIVARGVIHTIVQVTGQVVGGELVRIDGRMVG